MIPVHYPVPQPSASACLRRCHQGGWCPFIKDCCPHSHPSPSYQNTHPQPICCITTWHLWTRITHSFSNFDSRPVNVSSVLRHLCKVNNLVVIIDFWLVISLEIYFAILKVQRSAKRRGCLLSYSQAQPGRELTQPSPCLLAKPCTFLTAFGQKRLLSYLAVPYSLSLIKHTAGKLERHKW